MISKSQIHFYDDLFINNNNKVLFPNINNKIKIYILEKLLSNNYLINFNELKWKNKSSEYISFKESNFYKLNKERINEDGTFDKNFFQLELFQKFESIKKSLDGEMIIDDNDNDNNEQHLELIEKDVYKIKKHHTIADVYQAMFDSEGFCKFKYNFKSNRIKKQYITTIITLQRFEIKINSKINSYDHLAKLHYRCSSCKHEFYKSYNELESTNFRTECDNVIVNNEGKSKTCNKALSKPTQLSEKVNINIYDATILNLEGVPENILVESMEDFKPFIYDAVGFRLQDNGEKYLFIVDYLPIDGNKIQYDKIDNNIISIDKNKMFSERDNDAKDIIPYWFNFFDSMIKELSGDDVLGMYDIKFALIVQKICQIFYRKSKFFKLNYNIALLGDNDSGKTWTFEHYGYLFYGGLMKQTSGISISLPSLRGSSKSNRDIKKGNKNIPGLLTQYGMILIDEIDQNSDDIMSGLKPILLEPIYSNDKADGDKTIYTRTAHINITENVKLDHIGMMQGLIKKEYENLYNDPTIEKDGSESEKFSYDWDVFKQIETYTNLILKQAIINVRQKYNEKNSHFLDGRELAVHDRFPFWFVMKKTDDEEVINSRQDSVIDRMLNDREEESFVAVNKMLQQLTIDNINELFLKFKPFIIGNYTNKTEVRKKLKNIEKEYCKYKTTVSRSIEVLSMILNCSRILNCRKDFSEIDYNYVRRFLYIRDRFVGYDEFNDMNNIGNIEIEEENFDDIKSDFDNEIGDFQ